ncbi:MAG: VCBS repeat-containing protein, partial [Cyanobacteria bacterium J06592_8]
DFYTAIDTDFSVSHGYTSQNENPRMMGDINGDGRADIVGINDNQVRFAYGQADGTFSQPNIDDGSYNIMSESDGWTSQEEFPRMLADIDGDNRDDIFGYDSVNDKLMVAYASDEGFARPVELSGIEGDTIADFIDHNDYSYNNYPLTTADITGNGQDNIVGFGTSDMFAAVWS